MDVDHDQPALSRIATDWRIEDELGPEYSMVRNICLSQKRKNGVQGAVLDTGEGIRKMNKKKKNGTR